MKALSLKQPWASYVAIGRKTIETRTWSTKYRGKLLIVSSKTYDKNFPYANFLGPNLPLGMALAIVDLVDCRLMKYGDGPQALIYRPGFYSWLLAMVEKIDPFPVKGQLGLYEVDMPAPSLVECAICHIKIDPATLKGGRIKIRVMAGDKHTFTPTTWDWCNSCRERALKSKVPRIVTKEGSNGD